MSEPARERLPDRRLATYEVVAWEGREYLIGVGWYRDGRVGEVFLNGPKTGSDAEGLMTDACIELSLLLQVGLRPTWIAGRLAAPVPGDDRHAEPRLSSLIGLVAARAAMLERECGTAVREAYLCAERRHPLQQDGAVAS